MKIFKKIIAAVPVLAVLFAAAGGVTPAGESGADVTRAAFERDQASVRWLIPSGEAIGVKLYAKGALIVGISSVADGSGGLWYPARAAGLEVGDRIVEANGEDVLDADDFVRILNREQGRVVLGVVRGDKIKKAELWGVYSEESASFKAGLWVRDSTAGIGTLTFYDPQNSSFAALGHGICDGDTGLLMTLRQGSINACNIRGVIKGEKGFAGELYGDFGGRTIGVIEKNSVSGISGRAETVPNEKPIPAATRFEVEEGMAEILCDVDGEGVKAYDIEIARVIKTAAESGKNMVLRVTDEELKAKTGGIVQGMSGSPIIQNGKIVGAVTHVFVNDPTRGYGIFIENMME